MDLEYLEVTGVTNAQKWNADLSGGTGSTLPTTSGTNQATLINFPTDNSQWIFFSTGTTQRMKYYNGTAWVAKPLKYYNGSAWVEKPIKYHNGTSWV